MQTSTVKQQLLIFAFYATLTATTSTSAVEAPSIRLATSRAQINPDLTLAYHHLQRKSWDSAYQAYQKVLLKEPHNLDALLALTAIAQAQGHNSDAASYRQQALVSNPLDANVQAALLGAGGGNPEYSESRLKTLLGQHSQSATLNFVLGNLYARQKRWPEAQEAYFNASAVDRDNPDYLFNLAVSLDQMGQSKLASDHYQQALVAAQLRPAAFAPRQIEQRISELAP